MNNKYYRITCNGIGIYEYLKEYLWTCTKNPFETWNDFIKSSNVNWLNKPPIYKDKRKKYTSYFNLEGYNNFTKKTLSLIMNWIDLNMIKTEIVEIDKDKIIYEDEYQIVMESVEE